MALSKVLLVTLLTFVLSYGEVQQNVNEEPAIQSESAGTESLPVEKIESSTEFTSELAAEASPGETVTSTESRTVESVTSPESSTEEPVKSSKESRTEEPVKSSTVPSEDNTEYPTCPPHVRCGFQQYNASGDLIGKFMKYCTCPAGTECRQFGEHKSQLFYFYKCVSVTEDPFERVLSLLATQEETGGQTQSQNFTPSTASGENGVVVTHDDL